MENTARVDINPGLCEAVDKIIAANQDRIIESLRAVLRIPSVKGEPAPNAPFGASVREALDYTLSVARDLGFDCFDMDGYVGCIDYGLGDELLGVMCHLDVVPEGDHSLWTHPPYSAEIADGNIYARGALDDKGPAICALYALAAIKQAGLVMSRRVRIILGCDEESDWGCMKHYAKHGETPALAFSPDADYPVVNSEKGILHASFKRAFTSAIKLDAGTRPNVVPDRASIVLRASDHAIDDVLEAVDPLHAAGYTFDYDLEGDEIKITVHGMSAHAASPEMGKNALLAAVSLLSRLPLEGDDANTINVLKNAFNMDLHAETLGLDTTDQSGRTSINPGVMRWDENGISELSIDMRCPRSLNLNDVLARIKDALAQAHLEHFDGELKEGHFVPRDSELVSKLLEVYSNRTGQEAQPLAIGGGTYARAIPNAVAFGCERPGVPAPIHMPDEFIRIEDVMFNTYMMADAIIALAAEHD